MIDFYGASPNQQADKLLQLAHSLLFQWGLEGSTITLIKMRENAVFEVRRGDGTRYAMRMHRVGYHSDSELRSELQWMLALQESGVEVPKPIRNITGELYVVIDSYIHGGRRQVDLFEWVNGEHLSGDGSVPLEVLTSNFKVLGEIAAKIHNQSVNWLSPKGFYRKAWDIEGLVGENPLWGRFWELESLSNSETKLMIEVRDRLRVDLAFYKSKPENDRMYGMIHADLVSENVLVDGNSVRVIDFDDAGFGWHLFEVATALYFERWESNYEALKQAMIEGYRANRGLSDEQLSYLPLFMLARGTTYLGWVKSRPESDIVDNFTPMFIENVCKAADEYLSSK
ncbi:phosphotransferase enzyme family protein [Pseudoteredinibacter isoporae]|uniref:Ser/Thr protein kinase RdoA (MazF antagonist) n=1 Tax=Pseudoteredinibacter isoporae TaxID=570281 RepID=A0A7X0JUP9_9GAMM|nr:phosphotransferase [Pseudoteredinibacter isoporae]MBB6522517.1 Ser/Thr protein kinase RdoA (MazF antagonist) [Pseudoteredinibacter isoporae]NHO88046.1 phosphotransferase [Pseudoteredinibacter isoporae]NIB23623.1 phosphotransferase [Pseudoteredinibacter isoporae]